MVALKGLFPKIYLMKTNTKKSYITASKKPFNFKRFRRQMKRLEENPYGYRKPLLQRLFRPRYNSFFWKGTHNGVFGPGGHTSWEFRTGSLALLIALICLVLIIGFILFTILL